jgi:hypothetical protein
MKLKLACAIIGLMLSSFSMAQMSQQQRTNVKGNTEINVTTKNMTAVATGENNVAKNRVGVIQGENRGNMKINVAAANITTIASGRNKKACTNIGGVVSNECK